MKDLILLFSSAFISSGLTGTAAFIVAKLAFKQAVEDAIEKTVTRIHERMESLAKEISDIKDDVNDNYVTCKFCTMQHENVSNMNKAINAKLDILIADRGHK